MSIAAWWRRVTGAAVNSADARASADDARPMASPALAVPHDAVVIPPAPAPRALGDRVLRLGVPRGQDVAWVQARVGAAPADGWYGPQTAAAVAAWQDDQPGLLADGVVGPSTWRALGVGEVTAPAVFVPPLAVDAFTARVERALRAVGAQDPAAWAAVLSGEMQRHSIITDARMAAFLANITHETGNLTRLVEVLHYSAQRMTEVWPSRFPTLASAQPYAANGPALAERVYGNRMGNTQPGDGWRFRGRGCYQTTGRDNYTALARVTGEALEALSGDASPLETRAGAARSACIFWASMSGNKLADAGDSREIRRRGNGGYIGLEDVLAREAKIKAALG
ncbi:peptidoglycan-binding protein [Sediminicoccus sp. KRV36]|uniref:peptidoglycan-binding protein n=1 Tax=Sediminicoccus sp. KRV36 TaxID=3133721 RepID=UPI0020101F23|nr:peptidoglycan-binding protein [Sediminicoccus rosea]UPY35486.1 peptidoglycan-binding protein [Sediminicoccus rosea]